MPKSTKAVFKVVTALPEGVTASMMREYIEDAMNSWRGQLKGPGDDLDAPDDYNPLWYVGRAGYSIKVTRFVER